MLFFLPLAFPKDLVLKTHNKLPSLACSHFWLAHTLCPIRGTAQPNTWLGPLGTFQVQVKERQHTDVTCSVTTFVSPSHKLQERLTALSHQNNVWNPYAAGSLGVAAAFKNHATPDLNLLLVEYRETYFRLKAFWQLPVCWISQKAHLVLVHSLCLIVVFIHTHKHTHTYKLKEKAIFDIIFIMLISVFIWIYLQKNLHV